MNQESDNHPSPPPLPPPPPKFGKQVLIGFISGLIIYGSIAYFNLTLPISPLWLMALPVVLLFFKRYRGIGLGLLLGLGLVMLIGISLCFANAVHV
jgi:hypothetical protein